MKDWRATLRHNHERGPRWINSKLEHPEFVYNAAGCLEMICDGCGMVHYRTAIRVLEDGVDEECVRCSEVLLPSLRGERYSRVLYSTSAIAEMLCGCSAAELETFKQLACCSDSPGPVAEWLDRMRERKSAGERQAK